MLAPPRVCVPPATTTPPSPEIAPSKPLLPAVNVSVLLPSATLPPPDSVVIDAPFVVPEMSRTPSFTTPLDAAMLPVPCSASVPAAIVVVPV